MKFAVSGVSAIMASTGELAATEVMFFMIGELTQTVRMCKSAMLLLCLLALGCITPAFSVPVQVSTPPARLTPDRVDLDKDYRIVYGYIDHTMNFAIPPTFEQPRNSTPQDFSEGVAWVGDVPTYTLIDKSGAAIFTIHHVWIVEPFHHGVARVNRKWFINASGQVSYAEPKVSIEFATGHSPPSEPVLASIAPPQTRERGLLLRSDVADERKSVVANPDWFHSKYVNSGVGEFNAAGKLTFKKTQPRFGDFSPRADHQKIRKLSEDLLNVIASTPNEKIPHQCYINQDCEILIELPPNFVCAGDFHDGLAPVAVKEDPQAGNEAQKFLLAFVDKSGKIVIPPTFLLSEIEPTIHQAFYDGLAVLRLNDSDTVIDRTGRVLKRFISGSVRKFSEGLAEHSVLVDKEGKFLDEKDASHGIQSKSEYINVVLKALQEALKDLHCSTKIEFTLVPDGVDKVPNLVPDVVAWPPFWKDYPGEHGEDHYRTEHVIQERLRALRLPRRTQNLSGIRIPMKVEDGQVRLKVQYPGELD